MKYSFVPLIQKLINKKNMKYILIKRYYVWMFLWLLVSCRTNTQEQKYVDPFIGTSGDHGQLYPGATSPFGLVKLSPDTKRTGSKDPHSGYDYAEDEITGFSHLRVGGVGCSGGGGNILIQPGIGSCTTKREEYGKKYIKDSERASSGYYSVRFESGIQAEHTVSPRVGFHRYSFPENESFIRIDLAHSYAGVLDAELTILDNNSFSGMIKSKHVCSKGYYILYFHGKFDADFTSYKTWKQDGIKKQTASIKGDKIGGVFRFQGLKNKTVQLKIGISPIGTNQAKIECEAEIPNWNFSLAKAQAAERWINKLSRVEVSGENDELKTLFYTHLYHSLLMPVIAGSSASEYRPVRQEKSIHKTSSVSADYDYYCGWSTWDDFRKYSLINLVVPEIGQNIARSIVDVYKTRGEYVQWAHGYWPTPSVRNEFANAVLLDAFQKGLNDFDTEIAYKGMVEDYQNYGVGHIGNQLEKCYQAYIVMRMAEHLNLKDDIAYYRKEALAYQDHWNPAQKDNQGNKRGFFVTNAATVDDVEILDKYAYQGNLWHYRWFVPHDIKGLSKLRGSRNELCEDLEYFFDNNFYMHVNEPDIHAPYLFSVLGKPWLTQKWTSHILTRPVVQLYDSHHLYEPALNEKIYKAEPKGYLRAMDDDAGAMSSWFVCSAMGLFPIITGEPVYIITSPIFPEVKFNLTNDKTFKIIAKGVSMENIYIQSAKLNGKIYDSAWIHHDEILQGGILELEMGSTPNKNWGLREFPFSLSK